MKIQYLLVNTQYVIVLCSDIDKIICTISASSLPSIFTLKPVELIHMYFHNPFTSMSTTSIFSTQRRYKTSFTMVIAHVQFYLFNSRVHSRTYVCVCNLSTSTKSEATLDSASLTSSKYCRRLKYQFKWNTVCLRNNYFVHFLSVYCYFW